MTVKPQPIRHLVLVLGDQLNLSNPALQGFDPLQDLVWMAEVAEESTKVWTHQARIVLFLSAMRHFRETLNQQGFKVNYLELNDPNNPGHFTTALKNAVTQLQPEKLILCQPGEWQVQENFKVLAKTLDLPLEIREDTHFMCSTERFQQHVHGRKQLRMEFFYREMRQHYRILMEDKKRPLGGQWNFDPENRGTFGKKGPPEVAKPLAFPPDELTLSVMRLVTEKFGEHPGSLAHFDWPVTAEQAELALKDFIQHRLSHFGTYQDAMWDTGLLENQPYLFHSRLSAAMNLKLLSPQAVISAAEEAYTQGKAPLASTEGFIRQILGWREYVRGIYWLEMPTYIQENALEAQADLPAFYWNGQTEMNCLKQAISQTLEYGYAHHIQRLMVTGLFALLLGVNPRQVHQWYLAIYVDAVEWVELPNTLGMSQYGDGGLMASKPYVATGKYIQRMSNYCENCPYDPALSTGENACPFTTLYWDFLLRHEKRLSQNPRMGLQLRNLSRLKPEESEAIQQAAKTLRERLAMSRKS